MPFEMGMDLIRKAYAMEDEKKIFYRWVIGYEKEMSFSEFKQKLGAEVPHTVTYNDKTEKEILSEVKTILEMR